MAELRAYLLKRRKEREQELAKRKEAALAAAQRAAGVVYRYGPCRVWLFGSLAGDGTFGEHSDIDLAVEGLPPKIDFWRLYSEILATARPFDVDLIALDSAPPELKESIHRLSAEIRPLLLFPAHEGGPRENR